MRKAAGVILMVLGAYFLITTLVVLILSGIRMIAYAGYMVNMVCGAFAITGGVFCLKRRYWGACLVSGLVAFLTAILPVAYASQRGSVLLHMMLMNWVIWMLVGGAVVSIIFIIHRKKEWSEVLA